MIPSGNHELVMQYDIKAYHTGNTVAFISSSILILGLIAAIFLTIKNKKEAEA